MGLTKKIKWCLDQSASISGGGRFLRLKDLWEIWQSCSGCCRKWTYWKERRSQPRSEAGGLPGQSGRSLKPGFVWAPWKEQTEQVTWAQQGAYWFWSGENTTLTLKLGSRCSHRDGWGLWRSPAEGGNLGGAHWWLRQKSANTEGECFLRCPAFKTSLIFNWFGWEHILTTQSLWILKMHQYRLTFLSWNTIIHLHVAQNW